MSFELITNYAEPWNEDDGRWARQVEYARENREDEKKLSRFWGRETKLLREHKGLAVMLIKLTDKQEINWLIGQVHKLGYDDRGLFVRPSIVNLYVDKYEANFMIVRCEVCEKPTSKFCGKCKIVYYCSGDCQRRHFGEHKQTCTPFLSKSKSIIAANKAMKEYNLIQALQISSGVDGPVASRLLRESDWNLEEAEKRASKLTEWEKSWRPTRGFSTQDYFECLGKFARGS